MIFWIKYVNGVILWNNETILTNEIINDIALPLSYKLIYKSLYNPLIKLGLKIIPSFLVYKILSNYTLSIFEKEEEKLMNNHEY